ncbi:Innexin inx2 [Araneus ventricosus]|uniref:Innexin n=1 Tax=Araneus ventricosus TaxID=182803 RepID=A0A4Y2GX51_ARAVE|nr:Innexin inx2 [Araneus ventricosus]
MSIFKKIKKTLDFSCDVLDGVFVLHYGVTAFIFTIFAVVVSCNTKNEHVSCFKENDIPPKFLEAFCWMYSQFNGLETKSPVDKNSKAEQHKAFQDSNKIVFLCLIIAQVAFLAPKYFWMLMESGRLETLLSALNNNRNKKADNLKNLADAILNGATKNRNYFLNYLIAEHLNAINVTVSMMLLEIYLGAPSLGAEVDVIELADRDWALCWKLHCSNSKVTSQKFTKSVIHRYTSFGVMEHRDAMVMLPINMVYEKTYIFL